MYMPTHPRGILPLAFVTGCLYLTGLALAAAALDMSIYAPTAQPVSVRSHKDPAAGWEVQGSGYHLLFPTQPPLRVIDATSGMDVLWFDVVTAASALYSTRFSTESAALRLLSWGRWHAEVQWQNLRWVSIKRATLPIVGEFTLYAYPDRAQAVLTLRAEADLPPVELRVLGETSRSFSVPALSAGQSHTLSFTVLGGDSPLPPEALETISADAPLHYDPQRGMYVIGTKDETTPWGHIWSSPGTHRVAAFRITNDGTPRTIYLRHEQTYSQNSAPTVGVVLDAEGHPLPIPVQLTRGAQAFTLFPIALTPNESITLSSVHVYAQWGRYPAIGTAGVFGDKPVLQRIIGMAQALSFPLPLSSDPESLSSFFLNTSALGVPFRQPGSIEFQDLGGYRLLAYSTDQGAQALRLRDVTPDTSGPTLSATSFAYESTDGKIAATATVWSAPQQSAARHFARIEYHVKEPVAVAQPRTQLRLLQFSSRGADFHPTTVRISGADPVPLDFNSDHEVISTRPVSATEGYVAVYGDMRGATAVLIRRAALIYGETDTALPLAATVQCRADGTLEFFLAPDSDALNLQPNQKIMLDVVFLGAPNFTEPDRLPREVHAWITDPPRITAAAQGTPVSDWPPTLRVADGNTAEFTLQGGMDLVPVRITGLSDYKPPRLLRQEERGFVEVSAGSALPYEGVAILRENDGTYAATLLVASSAEPQTLRITPAEGPPAATRILVKPKPPTDNPWQHAVLIQAPWMPTPITLRFPESFLSDTLDFSDNPEGLPPRVDPAGLAPIWSETPDGTVWFEWQFDNQKFGGRLVPFEDEVELYLWFENQREEDMTAAALICPQLTDTLFDDRTLAQSWVYTAGAWKRMNETHRGEGQPPLCHYPVAGGPEVEVTAPWGKSNDVVDFGLAAVTSPDGRYLFSIRWERPMSVLSNAQVPCIHVDPNLPLCPPHRRITVRGKIYLIEGTLKDLERRVRRDFID